VYDFELRPNGREISALNMADSSTDVIGSSQPIADGGGYKVRITATALPRIRTLLETIGLVLPLADNRTCLASLE